MFYLVTDFHLYFVARRSTTSLVVAVKVWRYLPRRTSEDILQWRRAVVCHVREPSCPREVGWITTGCSER